MKHSMQPRSNGNRLFRWLAAAAAGFSFIVAFACNSPFIPIPPPDETFTASVTPGEWAVSTPPDSRAVGATFYIFNATLGSGIIQNASIQDGSMSAYPLMGEPGDQIFLHWEKSTAVRSSTSCRILGEGPVVNCP
jgi:hypothetical protein